MKKKLKAGFFSGNVKKCEQVGRIQTFYGKRKVFGKSVVVVVVVSKFIAVYELVPVITINYMW